MDKVRVDSNKPDTVDPNVITILNSKVEKVLPFYAQVSKVKILDEETHFRI